MSPLESPYVLIMLVAEVICIFIAVNVWPNRHKNTETIPFVLLLIGIVEWITAALLGLLDQNLLHNILWAKIEYFGVVSVPSLVFVYMLHHSGYSSRWNKKWMAWLVLIPVVTLILAWTNEYHGLIWASYIPYADNGLVLSLKTYGLGFWIHWIYSYLLLLATTVLAFRSMLVSAKIFRWQNALIVIGILAPWIGNVLYTLHLNPFKDLDLTPLAFSVTGIMLATGMLRWRLFDIKPIAYAAVISGMADGLIILDSQDRIIDVNPSAQSILKLGQQKLVGKKMGQIISDMNLPGKQSWWFKKKIIEIRLINSGEIRDYEFSASLFHDKHGVLGGRTIFLHDITRQKLLEEKLQEAERKHAEKLLREFQSKYRTLYENMSVGVIYLSADGSVSDANPAAERILGLKLIKNRNLSSINTHLRAVHMDGSNFSIKEHPGMISLKTGKILQNQLMGVYFPKEARYRWININTVPEFNPGEDKPFQVFMTFNDITDLKQGEMEVRRTAQEIRERNKELERFNKASVDRELRMIELKKQISELSKKLGQPIRPKEYEEDADLSGS